MKSMESSTVVYISYDGRVIEKSGISYDMRKFKSYHVKPCISEITYICLFILPAADGQSKQRYIPCTFE